MRGLIVAALVAFTAVAAQACSSTAESTSTGRLCTPGAYVFCKCADGASGSKLCHSDGAAFDACVPTNAAACTGGEVDDPDTGKPVVSKEDPTPIQTPVASNDCPGQATTLLSGVTVTIHGDTSVGTLDRAGKTGGACAVAVGANDQVYHLVPSVGGSLHVEIQGDTSLDAVTYLRTVCDDASTQASCGPPGADNFAQLTVNVVANTDYYLFVDGASGSKGTYSAALTLTPKSFCGDNVVDNGEACDDGNHNENDGCSAGCNSPNGDPLAGYTCPGQPVHLWKLGATVTGTGSSAKTGTSGVGGVWNAPSTTCSATGTNDGQDRIYAVTPHVSGTLKVTATPTDGTAAGPNLMLSARSTCDGPATQLACANASLHGAETISVPVTAGTPVYVGVDGGSAGTNAGPYTITFVVQ